MITIITVVYNGEKTIANTLESVCCQSRQPDEYLIIDGLSTDSTLSIVEDYSRRFPFIKVISEKDGGIYHAMNKGIKISKGDIIGILNSDDWYEADALKIVYNQFKSCGSGVYYGIQRNILNEYEYYLERTNHRFIGSKMIPHPATFVSSDLYRQFGLFECKYKYSSDLELIIRFKNNNVSFFPVDAIISNFRIGGASATADAALESLDIRYQNRMISTRDYFVKKGKVLLKRLLQHG